MLRVPRNPFADISPPSFSEPLAAAAEKRALACPNNDIS
jgi:hypothetical protein